MIYTASFFKPEDHMGGPGNIFSIANRQPRGMGLPLLDLFRPGKLFDKYKQGRIGWYAYGAMYRQRLRLRRRQEIEAWLETLVGDVTLCCWERKPAECHRQWAAEFLQGLGCEVTVR